MVEHETQKLKALDENHNQHLKDWRDMLRPRKKVTFPACRPLGPGWLAGVVSIQ